MEAVTVATGGDALLVVALEGVQPARILWHKGGRELLIGDHYSTSESEQAAQLVVHGATHRDSGTYTALVTATDGSQAKASVALRVAPQGELEQSEEAPVFLRTLTELAAKVGTRVRFLVELRNSRNVKLYWYHKNSEAAEDSRHKLLHEGNFFCIDVNPLVPGDEGTWRCMAENEFGQTSCSAALRVVVPRGYKAPVFLEELEAILTAEGTVSLECKVVGVPTPVLKWFKDGVEIKAGDVFGLTANAADPTSLGTYTCEAVNCMGRVVSSSRVRVASREGSLRPPSSKERRSPSPVGPPPAFKESLTDKKFKVGEKAELIIQVTVPPEVQSATWYSNGRQVEASDKYRLRDEGGGNLALEISPLELGDDGEWKAVVKNEGGYSTTSCKLTLTVPRNYRIPRFLEALRALLTEEGLVSFECKVVGYPTPVLKWFKDGQELKPGDVYQLSGTNSLGKYSCIAKNCMGEASSSAELTLDDIKSHLNEDEKEHLLATNVPPRFIHGLVSRDVKIGDSFKLTVQVTATTAPSSVTWYHEDEVISESSKFRISAHDSGKFHLEITSLDISDQGEWKCMACNDFGHSVTTASIKLVIPRHYKKPVFLEPLRAILSKEGTVNLECKVIGVPQPVLKWYKDGVELQPGDIHRIISGEDGTCCLGTYTCEATNCMGSASSSAALLGFEDQLMGRDKPDQNQQQQQQQQQPQQHDLRGVVRNPSLSTINEERSSQISVYESAEVSLVEEEDKAEVSVSIDGRDVSLSLYETPDLSEHDAKQIADMYAEEISDHLSGQDGNQAELPPLRIVKETSRKGPLIMEATVIDVENEAFDEYMSMAEGGYDDLRTEADVEELSAIEAVVVDEREVLRSDIADLPDVEVWGEEGLSPQTVSTEGRGVANISEANIMEQELRTLSEQGLNMLQEMADGEMMCHEGIMMNEPIAAAKVGELQSKAAKQAQAQASQVPGFEVAESQEQQPLSSENQLKKGVKVNKKTKRPIDVVEPGEQEGTQAPGKPKDGESKTLTENKKSAKKSKKAEGKKEKTAKLETIETSESTLAASIAEQQANVVIVESCAYNIEDVEILEAAPSLKELIIQNQFAEVLEASQIEAIIQQQVNVLSDQTSNVFNLEDPELHQAVLAQLSAAVVAQQMEQGYFSGAQDMPGAFSPEETSADFSEFHSLGEPVQCTELYGFESVEQMEAALASGQLAAPGQESYNQAVEAFENQVISADVVAFSNQENTGFQMSALEAMTAQDSLSQAQLLEEAQVFESSVPQARPTIEVLSQEEVTSEALMTEDMLSKQKEQAVSGVTEGESLSAIVTQPPELVSDESVQKKLDKKKKDKKRVSESEPQDPSASIEGAPQETKAKKAKIEKSKVEKKEKPSTLGSKSNEVDDRMESGEETSQSLQLLQSEVETTKDEAIRQNVQQAIEAKPTQLTESDSKLLQATVEQLVISDKPVEILETLDSSQKLETVVKVGEVKLTPNQLEQLKMIENPALDLQLAVEVTENLAEGKQINHKVFAPKGQLVEKLAASELPSEDGSKTVPVFEVTEVVDGGKLTKRKISVNKANIISSEDTAETLDALSLAESCTATLAEAITEQSEQSSAVVAKGTGLRSGEAPQEKAVDESVIAFGDAKDQSKMESTSRVAIQLDSESNKQQIQQHIQEAIAHSQPDLSANDTKMLQTAVEQFILSKKPIELIECVGPIDTQLTVKDGGVLISPKQLEELKLIKNLAAELGVAVEVTEQLSEGRQVTHKVISPKSPQLLEKLIETGKDSETESNSIPVFEITEVVDDGKVTKRKISMNKVELLTVDQKANSMSEVKLADICSSAISAVITDEVADLVAVANQATIVEVGQPILQVQQKLPVTGKKRVAKTVSDQPGGQAIQQTEMEGPKALDAVMQQLSGIDIQKDVQQAITNTQAELTPKDAGVVQVAVQQFLIANKPVDVLESMDSQANSELILREGEVQMTSNQFDQLKSLKNPAEDLQIAIEVTETLPSGKQISHKIISPKSSKLMKKLAEKNDDPTSKGETVPVFEVTEIVSDGKLTKRKVSVNKADIISIDDSTTIVDDLSISDMCTASLAEVLAEELQTLPATIFSVQLQAAKNASDAKSQQPTNAPQDESLMSSKSPSSPAKVEAETAAAGTEAKPLKPLKPKKGGVAPSQEIVSACEEILNAQGGTVEASDMAKYLDISATADEYIDQVIELASEEKSGVDGSKEALLNKKKLLLQKKQELIAKQEQARKLKELESAELSGETSTADTSEVSSVIETKPGKVSKDEQNTGQKATGETSSSSTFASVDMEALDGTPNKSKKIASKFEAAETKKAASGMPPELAMALQSKLADAGNVAEAILQALERGIAQSAPDVSDKTVDGSTVESLVTDSSAVLEEKTSDAADAVKPGEKSTTFKEITPTDSMIPQSQQDECSPNTISSKISSEVDNSSSGEVLDDLKAVKPDLRQKEDLEKNKVVDNSTNEPLTDAKLPSKSIQNQDPAAVAVDSNGTNVEKSHLKAAKQQASLQANNESISEATKVEGPPDKLQLSKVMDTSSGSKMPSNQEISEETGQEAKAPSKPSAKGVTNEGDSAIPPIKSKSEQKEELNKDSIVASQPPTSSSEVPDFGNDATHGISLKQGDAETNKILKVTGDGKEIELVAAETKPSREAENDAEVEMSKQRKDEANQKAQICSSSVPENVSVVDGAAALTSEITIQTKDTKPSEIKKASDQKSEAKTVSTDSMHVDNKKDVESDSKQTSKVSLDPDSNSGSSQEKAPGKKLASSTEINVQPQTEDESEALFEKKSVDNEAKSPEAISAGKDPVKKLADKVKSSEVASAEQEPEKQTIDKKAKSPEVASTEQDGQKKPADKSKSSEATTTEQEREKKSVDKKATTAETASTEQVPEKKSFDKKAKTPDDASAEQEPMNKIVDKKPKAAEGVSAKQEPEKKSVDKKDKIPDVASTEQEPENIIVEKKPKAADGVSAEQELEKKLVDKVKSSEVASAEQEPESKKISEKVKSVGAASAEQEPEMESVDRKAKSPELASAKQELDDKTVDKKAKPAVASSTQQQPEKSADKKATSPETASITKDPEKKSVDMNAKSLEASSVGQDLDKKPEDKVKQSEVASAEQKPEKKTTDKKAKPAEAASTEQELERKSVDKKAKSPGPVSTEQEPELKSADKKPKSPEAASPNQEPEKKSADKKAKSPEAVSIEQEPEKKSVDKKAKSPEAVSIEQEPEKKSVDKKAKSPEAASPEQEPAKKSADKKAKSPEAVSIEQEPEKKSIDKKAKSPETVSTEQEPEKKLVDKKTKPIEAEATEQEPEKKTVDKKAKSPEAASPEQEPEMKFADKKAKSPEAVSIEQEAEMKSADKKPKSPEAASPEQEPEKKSTDKKAMSPEAASIEQEPEMKSADKKPRSPEAASPEQEPAKKSADKKAKSPELASPEQEPVKKSADKKAKSPEAASLEQEPEMKSADKKPRFPEAASPEQEPEKMSVDKKAKSLEAASPEQEPEKESVDKKAKSPEAASPEQEPAKKSADKKAKSPEAVSIEQEAEMRSADKKVKSPKAPSPEQKPDKKSVDKKTKSPEGASPEQEPEKKTVDKKAKSTETVSTEQEPEKKSVDKKAKSPETVSSEQEPKKKSVDKKDKSPETVSTEQEPEKKLVEKKAKTADATSTEEGLDKKSVKEKVTPTEDEPVAQQTDTKLVDKKAISIEAASAAGKSKEKSVDEKLEHAEIIESTQKLDNKSVKEEAKDDKSLKGTEEPKKKIMGEESEVTERPGVVQKPQKMLSKDKSQPPKVADQREKSSDEKSKSATLEEGKVSADSDDQQMDVNATSQKPNKKDVKSSRIPVKEDSHLPRDKQQDSLESTKPEPSSESVSSESSEVAKPLVEHSVTSKTSVGEDETVCDEDIPVGKGGELRRQEEILRKKKLKQGPDSIMDELGKKEETEQDIQPKDGKLQGKQTQNDETDVSSDETNKRKSREERSRKEKDVQNVGKEAKDEEREKLKRKEEEKLRNQKQEREDEEKAVMEEQEKRRRREEEKLSARKKEQEEEEKVMLEEQEKRKRRDEEKIRKRKQEQEEEERAEAEEQEKRKSREEEKLKARKREKEEEEKAMKEEQAKIKRRQEEKFKAQKQQLEDEEKAFAEEQDIRKRREEAKLKGRKEDEEKAIKEEQERRKRREEEKLKARKQEKEEEEKAKIEEAEKRKRREEEKLRIRKQEEEEEEKAKVAEAEKRRKREEERLKARQLEQEEEERAMMEEKAKRKRREEEKLRARKQEEEEEERAKIEEADKRRRREEEKLKALKEREEILLKEEEERQARRKKQREDKEKELREEEERLRKANEEREEKRKRQKQEEAAQKKEEEAKEREKEEKRLQELEKRRQELDQKHRDEEKAILAEEEERKERRKQRLLAEEKAQRDEEERMQAEMDLKREKRKKMREAEEQEELKKKEAEIARKKKEEEERQAEKKKRQKQWEEEERAFEEAENKRRESKIKRQEADKLRAQEEEMLAGLERQRVDEDKKKLEEELRRREEAKRRQEEEVRKQGEDFLRKEEERRKRRAEELKRWNDVDEGGLDYTDRELVVEPLQEDRPKSRTSESGDVGKRDIRRRPKFSTKLQDRQTVKGTRVKLTCNIISSPEDPSPEVEWFKGGYPIKEDERIKTKYVDGLSSLEIKDVTRSDSGEYTCTAHNRHGRVTTSCDLRVKGEEEQKPAPPTFTTAIRERYVPEDDELVLSCHVTGFPQPKTTWLKDADKLPASPRFQSLLSEEGICTLIIKSPRTADSGVFSCHAENRVYRDEISSNIQVAAILAKTTTGNRETQRDDTEIPRFVSELCDQYVEENGTLTLQVEVAGSPAPEILWLFNGRTLTPSGKMRVSAVGQTHTLTVFQVTQKDLGTYSCRIQNPYGHAYTLSTVSFGSGRPRRFGGILKGATAAAEGEMRAPSFVDRPESMITAFRDEELSLSCTVLGEPTPRVSWLKGIHDVSNCGTSHKTVQGNTHSWTLRGVHFTDSGTYTVEAKNSHGTVRAYCSVKVKDNSRSRSYSPRGTERFPSVSHDEDQRKMSGRFIRDVPGKVGAIRAVDVGRNWVSLRWAKPEHSGSCPVTAYKVESWILGEEARWQELAVSPICSFDAYHLKQDREYLFRVTPRNKYGWGEVEMTPRPIRIGRTIEQPVLPRTLPRQVRCMPGGTVSLDAQVTGEPLPEVRWYKDGTAVDVNRYPRFSTRYTEGTIHNVFGLVHKVSLRIDDLHPEDEGKYELEAVNPGGRASSYTRLLSTSDCSVMEAHDKINSCLMALSRMDTVCSMAPQFTMRLRDRRVQVGFPVRLTCQIVGVPKPDVLWFKDGNPIAPDDTHHLWQEDGHFYSIELSDSQHEDAAIYSVTATNPYGCVACKCRLVVDSGLRSYISPMFLRELEDVSVAEGETITLQTVIEAYPTIGVVWHRDGQRIRPSRKHTFDLDEDGLATLEIEGADYSDGGIYTCTATNEMGTIESICRVSVSCKQADITQQGDASRVRQCPMFLRKPRTIDAQEGDMVVIECEVAGDPKPTVTWLRDWLKPSVYSDGSRFQEVGSGPVYRLEIPKCRVEDTGAYSILAKNEHGEARAVISLQVYTKGLKGELKGGAIKRGVMEAVPRVVRPLQDVRCCDGDAVTLETLFDAPHASLVRWEKQGRVIKETSDVSSDWDGSKARLKIRAVYPEDEGEYACIVYNDMGKAVTSAALVVEMADDKENDVTVQLEHRPDLSRRTTPSRTPSRYSRSPSVGFTREGSAHSWAGVGWREPSVTVPTWRPLSRGSSPLLFGRRYTPEPTSRAKQRRAHGPKFYYIPHDRIVEEGETVTFQCAIKGHPTPKTIWDKDSVKLIGGGRYKMEERNEVRTIEIPKVTQQDAGLYRVTIENDLGREQATARLDVIKASSNKYAGYVRNWHTSPLTAPRFTRTLPFTSIRDGSRMKLSTEFRGSPSPRAKWYRNHELLPNCSDYEQTCSSTSATLELPCVSCNDAGTYTCMIVSDRGRAQCSCQVTVEHHHNRGAAPHFTKALQHDTALDGDPLRLGVTLHGSQPMKVLWVKNDQLIESSKRVHTEASVPQPTSSSIIEDSRHWLQFEDVIPEDSGVYFCEAYNQHGEAYSYCRLKVVDPNSVPACPPCIIGALTPLHITEGTRARFRATVRGHPTPALTWELDGQPIVPSRTVQISATESDDGLEVYLSFLCAACIDSGTVTLHARNAAGRQSVHTTLQVIPRERRDRPSSTPRSAAEERATPQGRKHRGSAVFKSSSSSSVPSRSISPSSRSRPPVRHHSFAAKSTRVAHNTEVKSDRWRSSVTGRSPSPKVTNSVESSASSNSSTVSSPRSDSARAVSPQLTYQFKSSSPSPARNTIKSRSPSPRIRQCSKTNLINHLESNQSSFKPIAQKSNSFKPAVIVKPIIPKSLALNERSAVNSTSPSTISSPTSNPSQGPSLPTGRPPTPRSKASTSPAPNTELRSPTSSENSQFSRSISPVSSGSPSPVSRPPGPKSVASVSQTPVLPPSRLHSSRSPVTRSHSSRSPSSRSPVSKSPSFRSTTSRSPSPSWSNGLRTQPPRSSTQSPLRATNVIKKSSPAPNTTIKPSQTEASSPKSEASSISTNSQPKIRTLTRQEKVTESPSEHKSRALSKSPRTIKKVTGSVSNSAKFTSPVKSQSPTLSSSPRNGSLRTTPRSSPSPRARPALKDPQASSMDSAYCSGRSSAMSASAASEVDVGFREKAVLEAASNVGDTPIESPAPPKTKEAENDLDAECAFVESEDDEEGVEIIAGPIDVIVTKGQSATLTLSYNGNPPPEVTWLKKDTILRDDSRYTVRVGRGVSSLTIHDVTADDSAKYTAVVRNAISAHAGFASLSVEDVPEPPSAQANLSEVGAGCVTLSWYGPAYDGGSVVTGYTVETRKVGQVEWTELVNRWHSTSYKVTGQEVGGQYEYRVKAHNIHGLSEPSKPSQPITLEGNENPNGIDGNDAANGEESEDASDDEIVDFEHSCVDFQPGDVFAQRFDMHEEVGKGRFGIVYRCSDKLSKKQRAAKIIKCIQSKEKEKVREEMSIMNALRHPKLLQLAAAFERARDVVMVMEFIAGGELFERVVADDFTLTERDVILFMKQICEGVQYMHSNNILHLDLKPENILCVRKSSHKIKLIDFGLARRFNPAEPCRVLFGTPEFIAPEIINYEPISFYSDMWSVGVICYVLLSGLSPFMGDNDAETFANITRAEFDFDDDAFSAISEGAKGFITALLINRKERRLTSSQCLQHPWLTQHEGTMNKRVIPTDKLKKFIIRRKWQACLHPPSCPKG